MTKLHEMLPEEQIRLVKSLLTELYHACREVCGPEYKMSLLFEDDDEVYTLSTSDFCVYYDFDDCKFKITFVVGTQPRKVFVYSYVINLVFIPEEYDVLDDCYVNLETQSVVFGEEAVELKQKHLLAIKGQIKCPVCDKIYPTKLINNDGQCVFCEQYYGHINWN